jgi:hypothetical protein
VPRNHELEEQVARLTALVDSMRARLDAMDGVKAAISSPDPASRSRRDLLKLGGAAAIGAIGGVALRTLPASAANGGNMIIGQANVGTAPTTLGGSATPNQVLGVSTTDFASAAQTGAGTFSGPLQGLGGGSASPVSNIVAEGVNGWAGGNLGFGVYGLTDSGVGVTGESSTGASIYARGSGRIQQQPRPGGGDFPPDPTILEQVRDTAGTLWLSNGAATPTWRRASTFEVFGNPRRVYGQGVLIPPAASTGDPAASVTNIDATQKIGGAGASGVPAGAVAAWCAVLSYQTGAISIYPANGSDSGIAAWSSQGTAGNGVNMLYMLVPLSPAGKFSFTNYFTSKKIYFDVWGYLSASA